MLFCYMAAVSKYDGSIAEVLEGTSISSMRNTQKLSTPLRSWSD